MVWDPTKAFWGPGVARLTRDWYRSLKEEIGRASFFCCPIRQSLLLLCLLCRFRLIGIASSLKSSENQKKLAAIKMQFLHKAKNFYFKTDLEECRQFWQFEKPLHLIIWQQYAKTFELSKFLSWQLTFDIEIPFLSRFKRPFLAKICFSFFSIWLSAETFFLCLFFHFFPLLIQSFQSSPWTSTSLFFLILAKGLSSSSSFLERERETLCLVFLSSRQIIAV